MDIGFVLQLRVILSICSTIMEIVLEDLGDFMGVMQAARSQLISERWR